MDSMSNWSEIHIFPDPECRKYLEDQKAPAEIITLFPKQLDKYDYEEMNNYDPRWLENVIGMLTAEKMEKHVPNILSNSKLVIAGEFRCVDDFTFYIKRKTGDVFDILIKEEEKRLFNRGEKSAEKHSLDHDLTLLSFVGVESYRADGRAVICSCSKGSYWSITFRKKNGDIKGKALCEKLEEDSRYKAALEKKSPDFLNSISDICQTLYEKIFPENGRETTGLVVVGGRTNSAKSKIIRGLIFQYLSNQHSSSINKQRALHLLTVEDPIEEYFYTQCESDLSKAQDLGLDYTPRVRGVDVADIKSAVDDALRQTLAAMFIGETRDSKDWEELIRFAGTGHLVFTTSHAGSVKEMMGQIFRATKAATPTARSVVASRICALIHLRPGEVKSPDCNILLPAIWMQTSSGMQTIMSEGLASLLPHNPGQDTTKLSSYGCRWFAKKLLKKDEKNDLKNRVIQKSIEWDMEGI